MLDKIIGKDTAQSFSLFSSTQSSDIALLTIESLSYNYILYFTHRMSTDPLQTFGSIIYLAFPAQFMLIYCA